MSEPRNQVVQVTRFGDADGLEVVDAPMPMAGRGEVRVRVLASGIEYTDTVLPEPGGMQRPHQIIEYIRGLLPPGCQLSNHLER